MIYTREEIETILQKILARTPVKRVILFGSYAKGGANRESDIDLVVDSDGALRGLDFFGLLETIAQAFDAPVDVMERSQIEEGSRVAQEILRTGVVVYEKEDGAGAR